MTEETTKTSKATSTLCPDAKPFVYHQQYVDTGQQEQVTFSNFQDFNNQVDYVAAETQPPCNDWVIHEVPTYMTNCYPFVQSQFDNRYSTTPWPYTSEAVIQPMYTTVQMQPFPNIATPQVYSPAQYYVPPYNYSNLVDTAPKTTPCINACQQATAQRKETYRYAQGQRAQRLSAAEVFKGAEYQQAFGEKGINPSDHSQATTGNCSGVPGDVSSHGIPEDATTVVASSMDGANNAAYFLPYSMFKSSAGPGERNLTMDYLSRNFATSVTVNDQKNDPANFESGDGTQNGNTNIMAYSKVVDSEDCFTQDNHSKTFASLLKCTAGNSEGFPQSDQENSSNSVVNEQFGRIPDENSDHPLTSLGIVTDRDSASFLSLLGNTGNKTQEVWSTGFDFIQKWSQTPELTEKRDEGKLGWSDKRPSRVVGRRHSDKTNEKSSYVERKREGWNRESGPPGKDGRHGLRNIPPRMIKNGRFPPQQPNGNPINDNKSFEYMDNPNNRAFKGNYAPQNFIRGRYGANGEEKWEINQELWSANSVGWGSNQGRNANDQVSERHENALGYQRDVSITYKENVPNDYGRDLDGSRDRQYAQRNFQRNRRREGNDRFNQSYDQNEFSQVGDPAVLSYQTDKGNRGGHRPDNTTPVDDGKTNKGKRFRTGMQESGESQPAVKDLSSCVGKLVLLRPETHSAILGGMKGSTKAGGQQQVPPYGNSYPVLRQPYLPSRSTPDGCQDTLSSCSRQSYSGALKKGSWNMEGTGNEASSVLEDSDHDNNNFVPPVQGVGTVFSMGHAVTNDTKEKDMEKNRRGGFPYPRRGSRGSDIDESSECNNRNMAPFTRRFDRSQRDYQDSYGGSQDMPHGSGSRIHKPKANAPIQVNIMDALVVKKKEKVQERGAGRKYDKGHPDTFPSRRRGREREFQRQKQNMASTKKILLKEGEEQRIDQPPKPSHHSSSENVSTGGNTSDSDSGYNQEFYSRSSVEGDSCNNNTPVQAVIAE